MTTKKLLHGNMQVFDFLGKLNETSGCSNRIKVNSILIVFKNSRSMCLGQSPETVNFICNRKNHRKE
jgi:hypothetical protein